MHTKTQLLSAKYDSKCQTLQSIVEKQRKQTQKICTTTKRVQLQATPKQSSQL